MRQANQHMAGFTLLETLIAVVLLSVGLLGIAGMQVKTQKFNRSAYFETQAVVAAHDMLERVRANFSGQNKGYYHLPTPTKQENCNTITGCSDLEMAQNDMYEWVIGEDSIINKLPVSSATICIDSTPDDGSSIEPACDYTGNVYAIKIWWTNANDDVRRAVITATFE